MLRSDNPIKHYRSLYISHRWVGVLNHHASFVILLFPHQTKIVLNTLTFKLQPLILNLWLPNTFRSDHLIKSFVILHISHSGRFGV